MVAGLVSPRSQLEVSDAALPLMMLRQQACDRWQRTGQAETDSFRMVVTPRAQAPQLVLDRCYRARQLTTVTRWVESLEALIASDRHNRTLVHQRSLPMTSYFDAGAVTPEMIRVLGSSEGMPYHVGYGPMQMKLYDLDEVLVAGPDNCAQVGLLWLRGAPAIRAATGYLDAVRRTSVAASALVAPEGVSLTPRQHAVARLLTSGLRDTDAAERLGVSLRTFRTEVARILDELGCETRFAAGARYSVWASSQVDAGR
ncbi:helix-turn-helix domain-containing protein [Nocardioides euryhalodurans]|uniref:LuxR family transcriptional regulator n=1 Tax=Nocardioides euryhalodurans TaxID=2518370 RepID=A0A4P7GJS3_9ACTN|nr:helix-turn-helix transcriptional regulator [Nocardioides euryhalodurans]QBR92235.1 LuxR family transcriptional regulator [Nocardioides euryhalodurans]